MQTYLLKKALQSCIVTIASASIFAKSEWPGCGDFTFTHVHWNHDPQCRMHCPCVGDVISYYNYEYLLNGTSLGDIRRPQYLQVSLVIRLLIGTSEKAEFTTALKKKKKFSHALKKSIQKFWLASYTYIHTVCKHTCWVIQLVKIVDCATHVIYHCKQQREINNSRAIIHG